MIVVPDYRVFSLKEVASILGISLTNARYLLKRGYIRSISLGANKMVTRDSLIEYIDLKGVIDDTTITLDEAADELRVSKATIRRYLEQFGGRTVFGKIRIPKENIRKFLAGELRID